MAKTKTVGGTFTFDSALLILKAGGRVTRLSWGGRGNWVRALTIQTSATTHHDMERSTSDGKTSPYTPNVADIFAGDWIAEHISDLTQI